MVELSREDILFLAVAVLAQAYITPRLPELSNGGVASLLDDPTTQSLLTAAVIFIALHGTWTYGRDLLSKDEEPDGSFGIVTSSNPPSTRLYGAVIRFRGVDWEGQFGTTRGTEITYVEGPYCPMCETELSYSTKYRRIRSNQKQWNCPSCGFTASRETDTSDSQREMAEKIIENEADDAINNLLAQDEDRIEELVKEIFEEAIDIEPKVEDFLDDPESNPVDEEMRQAFFDAIEMILDEDTIRQDPTIRVVLRKTFGYTLPSDNRTYEVMDEDIIESAVRRQVR